MELMNLTSHLLPSVIFCRLQGHVTYDIYFIIQYYHYQSVVFFLVWCHLYDVCAKVSFFPFPVQTNKQKDLLLGRSSVKVSEAITVYFQQRICPLATHKESTATARPVEMFIRVIEIVILFFCTVIVGSAIWLKTHAQMHTF